MAVTICLSTDTKVGKGGGKCDVCMCVCIGWDGGVACKGEKESVVPHLFVLVKCWQFRVMVVWGMGGVGSGCGVKLKAVTVEMEPSHG